MLHLALYGLIAIVVAIGLFLLAARFLPAGEQIAPPLRDEPPWELPPERNMQAADVDSVRLPVALRGYRFAETDILLDRLAGELRSRDAEIARLRTHAEDERYRSDDDPERYAPPPVTAPPIVLEPPVPPAAVAADDSDPEPATEAATEADAEPATEAAAEPVAEPAAEPVAEAAAEPVPEPAADAVVEPAAEQRPPDES